MNHPSHLLLKGLNLLVSLLLVSSFHGYSQLSHGGIPFSATADIPVQQVPVVLVTPPDLSRLMAEDVIKPVPYRFAVNLPVERHEGRWIDLPEGDKAWFLTISSPGALALTLYFDPFQLPEGGRLFVYNEERTTILGAFTNENRSVEGTFATALVPGDRVMIEYNHPASVEELPVIRISEMAYAYRGIPEMGSNRGFGSSGPCEVNVNCQEGEPWQMQKAGVMRIGVKIGGGTYWCSGSLVNNTRLDYTPYVLTADHCGQGATAVDISKWIFYFGFESAGCPNPHSAPSWWSLSGATLKAASGDVNLKGSDFFLVLLDDAIPDTAGAWFNGWNRLDIPSAQGIGIHHPQGDIKKISTYTTPLIPSFWGDQSEMTHWEVHWSSTVSGHGVTEPGSSGSPLFDASGRIVGVLTGGEASCDSFALTRPDYYGKFSWSWDMNGPTPDERLDVWLDPDHTGAEVLDGIPLNISAPEPPPEDLVLYPNPVSGNLYVKSVRLAGQDVRITISDSRGLVVGETSINAIDTDQLRINLSALPDGFYLVTFQTATSLLTGRVIKIRD